MSERGTHALADEAAVYAPEPRLRQALEALARATERAERAEAALGDITERLVRLELGALEQGRFVSALAHEMRNPLAPIRSASYLIRKNPSDVEAVLKAEAMVERQVVRLTGIANDLSDLGRAWRGEIEIAPAAVDLAGVFGEIAKELEPSLARRGQRLSIRWVSGRCSVLGNQELLVRALRALVLGAVSSTPDGAEVPIEISAEAGMASIVATCVEHTNERPHREHATALALARELTFLHSGRFVAEGEGVRIDLPLFVSDDVKGSGSRSGAAEGPTGTRLAGSGGSVLVIEDNRDSAEALANCLSVLGYDVHVAYDSAQGLALAEERKPVVVICDIGLPDLDGYEVAKRLRRSPATAHSTLIALTGYGLEDDKALSVEAGFDHHLIKPIGIDELEALMKRVAPVGSAA